MQRVELRQRQIWRAAGRALSKDEEKTRSLIAELRDHPQFSPEHEPSRYRRFLGGLLFAEELPTLGLGRRVLDLPLPVVRTKHGKALLQSLRASALEEAAVGAKGWRGYYLEAAVAADQLLSDNPCTHRLLILGATALGSEGQPISEWDVLRLDLLKNRDWRLVAVECSVTESSQKASEDRDKLERLGEAVDQRFSDLCEYRALLATPGESQPQYVDSRRGFSRT